MTFSLQDAIAEVITSGSGRTVDDPSRAALYAVEHLELVERLRVQGRPYAFEAVPLEPVYRWVRHPEERCARCGGSRRIDHAEMCPSPAEQINGPTYCPGHPCPDCKSQSASESTNGVKDD